MCPYCIAHIIVTMNLTRLPTPRTWSRVTAIRTPRITGIKPIKPVTNVSGRDRRDDVLTDYGKYVGECWYSAAQSSQLKTGTSQIRMICGKTIEIARTTHGRVFCRDWRVREKGGIVWIYMGKHTKPPEIFAPSQLGRSGWAHVYDELIIHAPHWAVMENVVDNAHVTIIHNKSTRGQFKSLVNISVDVDHDENVLTFRFPLLPRYKLYGYACATLPSNSFIEFQLPFGLRYIVFGCVTPIDHENTVIRFCSIRNIFPWRMFDSIFLNAMHTVLAEDKWILEKLRPDLQDQEFSVPLDAPQLAFRKMRKKMIDAGNEIV